MNVKYIENLKDLDFEDNIKIGKKNVKIHNKKTIFKVPHIGKYLEDVLQEVNKYSEDVHFYTIDSLVYSKDGNITFEKPEGFIQVVGIAISPTEIKLGIGTQYVLEIKNNNLNLKGDAK